MRGLRQTIGRLYGSPRGRAAFALVLAVLLLAAGGLVSGFTFYENDDTNIAFTLAGYFSGAPYPTHPFINCLLGFIVSFFYRVLPAVPWWLVFQLAAVALSAAVLTACVLKAGRDAKAPVVLPLLIACALLSGLVLYAMLLATFTLTAAVAGAAGVALVLTASETDPSKARGWRLAFAAAFLAASFLFRNSSGLSVLCFFIGALVYRFAAAARERAGKRRLMGIALYSACCLLLAAALVRVNAWGIETYNEPEFSRFDTARSGFLDYPVDSYADNPALYESVGWDRPLYGLVRQWFYMDGRVTAESLEKILAGSRISSAGGLAGAAADWREFASARPPVTYLLLLPAGLMLLLTALLPGAGKGGKLAALFGCLMLAGGAVLAGYLLLSGRMVLRALQLLMVPAAFSAAILALYAYARRAGETEAGTGTSDSLALCACARRAGETNPSGGAEPDAESHGAEGGFPNGSRPAKPSAIRPALNGAPRSRLGAAARRAAAALALLILLFAGYKSARITLSYDSAALLAKSRALMQYALAHPDDVLIRDTRVANNVDAVTTYPDQKPTNLLDWGGTTAYTGAKALQLERLGLGAFTADVFLRDGVYFVTEPDSRDCKAFAAYLISAYGEGARLELVDTVIDGVAVYRVAAPETEGNQ